MQVAFSKSLLISQSLAVSSLLQKIIVNCQQITDKMRVPSMFSLLVVVLTGLFGVGGKSIQLISILLISIGQNVVRGFGIAAVRM